MITENETNIYKLPIVEIFESIQGEGTKAGYITTFIRIFGCNLRCKWCDTNYSYAPAEPKSYLLIDEIIQKVNSYNNQYICITGGEPLLYTKEVIYLIKVLSCIQYIKDIHIETNGAVNIKPFVMARNEGEIIYKKLRFIMDYKLNTSGETEMMLVSNYKYLNDRDEIKFVIGSEQDFEQAKEVITKYYQKGIILFSPICDMMHGDDLVNLLIKNKMNSVKFSLQIHKVIWGSDVRGV